MKNIEQHCEKHSLQNIFKWSNKRLIIFITVSVYTKREDNQDMVTITKAYVHKQQSSECQQGDNYMQVV